MELTGKQKTLHVIFRILIFVSFAMTAALFFALIFVIALAEDSYTGYNEWGGTALTSVYMYYVLLALGVATTVFSVVCCKCGEVAAVVTRTVFLAVAFGINCTAISLFKNIRFFAKTMAAGQYFDLYNSYTYTYFDSDQFGIAFVLEMFALIVVGVIYFSLSITSIVALAKKPNNNANNNYYNAYNNGYNNGYYNQYNNQYNNQQRMYNNPNMYQNGNMYNNGNMNQNPNMYNNGNMNQNPNMYNNGNMNQNPNMYNNPNMYQNGAMNQNPNMYQNGAMNQNQNPNMYQNGAMNQNQDANMYQNMNTNVNPAAEQDSVVQNQWDVMNNMASESMQGTEMPQETQWSQEVQEPQQSMEPQTLQDDQTTNTEL